mgnify:FL=1
MTNKELKPTQLMGCLNCGAILFKEGKKVFFEDEVFCDINCLNEWLYKKGVTMGNKNDIINHPDHYTVGGIETIDFIQAKMSPEEFKGYLTGNILKYITRYKHKNGLEDLKKAQWYLDKLIGVMTDETI